MKITFSILSEGGTGRLVCILPILIGANLEVGVTFLMRRIPNPCSLRLTICEGDYDANDGAKLLQILTFLLMMIRMAVTGPSKGLLPVSFSHVMRITIMSVKIGAHLAKSWEKTL